jgi:hypothetical protein
MSGEATQLLSEWHSVPPLVAALQHWPVVAAGKTDALTLASINATILAIFLAALTAYFLIHLQAIEGMKTELIERASPAKVLKFGLWLRTAEVASVKPIEMWAGVLGVSIASFNGLIEDSFDESEQGALLLPIICHLATSYPFPGDPFQGKTLGKLDTEDEIERWLPEYEEAADAIAGTPQLAEERVLRLVEFSELAQAKQSGSEADGTVRGVYEDLLEFGREAQKIARSIRSELDRLRRYRRRMPTRISGIGIGFIIGLAFFCGVTLPMVDSHVTTVLVVWLPTLLYMIGLAVAVVGLVRLRAH